MTGPMELKTQTPWILLGMIIYLVLLMHGFSTENQERGLWKEPGKRSLERGLCNNNKNHKYKYQSLQTISGNIQYDFTNTNHKESNITWS